MAHSRIANRSYITHTRNHCAEKMNPPVLARTSRKLKRVCLKSQEYAFQDDAQDRTGNQSVYDRLERSSVRSVALLY